jgi:hypothetical protein
MPDAMVPGMSFILGVLLFVGLVGYLDSRLPWPPAREATKGRR